MSSKLVATGASEVFSKVISFSALAVGAIAIVASALGWIFAGINGVYSALIGAGVCLGFSLLTALSVKFGGQLNLGGFFAVVMGGWILKLVLFFILIAFLRRAEFINGPVFFFSLVAAILASLAIDSMVFLKARIAIEPNN